MSNVNDGVMGASGKINVTGRGEVKVMPDRARLSYRSRVVYTVADDARKEVEGRVTAFVDAVASLNLDPDALVADSINITPEYRWNDVTRAQEFAGYAASRCVEVKISDFALIAKINELAVQCGLNEILGFEYTVSERKKYETAAARIAIEDAKERAALLAEGFGVKMGEPLSLSFQEYGGVSHYAKAAPRFMGVAAQCDSAANTYTVEPLVITATVEASFSIIPQE